MKVVEPIRDLDKLENIKNRLLKEGKYRDYCLFVFGVNIGLRISDLAKLKWSDVYNDDGEFRQYVDIYEQKTGKSKRFPLNDASKSAIGIWREHCPLDRPYIFNSRSSSSGYMSRSTAYRIIRREAEKEGLDNIGTHSLRKTFGYHLHKNGISIAVLMKLFNHSEEKITMRYLGIDRDMMDDAYMNLNL